jgi:hypothetical protein
MAALLVRLAPIGLAADGADGEHGVLSTVR